MNRAQRETEREVSRMWTTTTVDPTVTQMRNWIDRGLCGFCGNRPDIDRCRCRECPSCSTRWLSSLLRDYSDGRPATELCPECFYDEEQALKANKLRETT